MLGTLLVSIMVILVWTANEFRWLEIFILLEVNVKVSLKIILIWSKRQRSKPFTSLFFRIVRLNGICLL